MKYQPLTSLAAAMLAASGWAGTAKGSEIRNYSPERHDRFSGFPEAPAWNDTAWQDGRTFAAVGWWVADPRYQFALVSPRHFVCAAHALPSRGQIIRFLSPAGDLLEREILGRVMIQTVSGESTDLALGTLADPPGNEIEFFPYLNLPDESAYRGNELVVFGWNAKVGRGVFDSFQDSDIEGFENTRLFQFLYSNLTGDPDDAYLVKGDSGSPSFGLAAGRPALVGVHGAVADNGMVRTNYDTFVPHYVAQLDALLEVDGYRMTPAYPLPVELVATVAAEPLVLRQAKFGSARFEFATTSGNATNLKLVIRFPVGAAPDVLDAPGWIVEDQLGEQWTLRRGGIDEGNPTPITASWQRVPQVSELVVELSHRSDGSPLRTHLFELAPAPSYAAWSSGLTDPDPSADPDGDGVLNLLEYAFGGDPLEQDLARQPVFESDQSTCHLSFPTRTDAERRGIWYLVEYSTNLKEDSWTTAPPPGQTVEEIPLSEGRTTRKISFTKTTGSQFCRLRVVMDEGAAAPSE